MISRNVFGWLSQLRSGGCRREKSRRTHQLVRGLAEQGALIKIHNPPGASRGPHSRACFLRQSQRFVAVSRSEITGADCSNFVRLV